MAMTLKDIRDSGLLELYVLGDISAAERTVVEEALTKYPELLDDINSIENGLKFYGKVYAVTPPAGTMDNIINEINNEKVEEVVSDQKEETHAPKATKEPASNRGRSSIVWPLLLLASLAGGFILYTKANTELKEAEQKLADCQENSTAKDQELSTLRQISNPNNVIVKADATDKYPDTKAYIHNDEDADKTYLQIQNLPPITENQSYQLWSLKGDLAPIPLDVFDASNGEFFEVQHIEATNAYAITIEPKGGQQTPTLENLIGVFSISS